MSNYFVEDLTAHLEEFRNGKDAVYASGKNMNAVLDTICADNFKEFARHHPRPAPVATGRGDHQPHAGEARERVLVRLLVVAVDKVEGEGVVALVLAAPVHWNRDARTAVALPGACAYPLQRPLHQQRPGGRGPSNKATMSARPRPGALPPPSTMRAQSSYPPAPRRWRGPVDLEHGRHARTALPSPQSAPQMDNPIDDYFAKQEQCQHITEGSKYEINDDGMVGMLVEHMGKTGTLTKSTVKFNKQLEENKTWTKAKEWFRDALDDIMEMQKYSGADQELLANAAVDIKRDAVESARDEIANGMSESFDLLAQAAVAKSDTIDAHAATIIVLTKSLAEATATITTLTETNAKLVAELAKCSST